MNMKNHIATVKKPVVSPATDKKPMYNPYNDLPTVQVICPI